MNGEWAAEPPTVPGWYWAILDMDYDIEYFVYQAVHVYSFESGLRVACSGVDYLDVEDFAHWLGPLPAPAPPQAVP